MADKNLYKKITENIGADDLVKDHISIEYGLLPLIKRGLYKRNLLKLAECMSLPLKEFSALLPVSERTIRRYKNTQRLSSNLSEHLLKIAELYTTGVEVFGGRDKFLHWLNTNNKVVSTKPIKLLDTITGINLLMNELGRIEHGVYI